MLEQHKMTFPSLLDNRQLEIWQAEKLVIERLIEVLTGWEAVSADLERLRLALHQLDELFLLVVVGEFNSGKSALINALLGQSYLLEGVTPTTDRVYIVRYGDPGPPEFAGEDVRVVRFPSEFLREINIVDTPGTNAVLRRHESIVRDFIPRSDLVIFVTSADRPFTESEHTFMEHIQQWGKKIVVVINKVDILENPAAIEEVSVFVKDQVNRLLGLNPDIFPLSARLGLRQETEGGLDDKLAQVAGFSPFRQFLTNTLSQEDRIRLKLLSPLGVARKIAVEYLKLAQQRLSVLTEDAQVLEKVERHLSLFEKDTQDEFARHLARIDNQLLEMRLRGEEFLDDRMRLLKIRAMLNNRMLRQSFERDVVGDTPDHVEGHVQEIIDWLVERELRQWRLMAEELSNRRETEVLRQAAQEATGGFAYNRRQLLDTLGSQAERVVGSFDRQAEAGRLASTFQESVAMVGVVEVGAVGLGLVLKALLVGATADATGILAAGVLGLLGLAIIPYRRGVAKRELRTKMEAIRSQLRKVLSASFGQELERSLNRLREAIAPYRRFVLDERGHIQGIVTVLEDAEKELQALQTEIEWGGRDQAH
jgi:small GTP-binding protein